MENAARNGMRRWLGSDPWPKIIGVVTVGAVGGAYAVFNLRPWGPWCAAALMAGWAVFAISYGARQARLEGRPLMGMSLRDRLVHRPIAAVLQIALGLAWLTVGALLFWLNHVDAPTAQVEHVNLIFWTLMLGGWIVEVIADALYDRLERRRLRTS